MLYECKKERAYVCLFALPKSVGQSIIYVFTQQLACRLAALPLLTTVFGPTARQCMCVRVRMVVGGSARDV